MVGRSNSAGRAASFLLGLAARPGLLIFLLPLGALAVKIRLMMPAATDSFVVAVLQHDAALFAAMLALYAAGSIVPPAGSEARWKQGLLVFLPMLARLAWLVLLVLYVGDVFAYFFFATRLYVSDVVTFSSELNSAGSLVKSGWHIMTARRGDLQVLVSAMAALAALAACILFLVRRPVRPARPAGTMAAAIILFALYLVPLPSYVYAFGDKPLFENLVERNKSYFEQTSFSDGFRARVLASPPGKICRPGSGRRLNVMVVMVESLSAYQSKAFSGIEDWTPELDTIAARETALTNFHANGWTTIGGLISLLGGDFPFVPEAGNDNAWGSPRLTDFLDLKEPLPRALAADGYRTVFAGAGDTAFLGQADWLRTIGFERVIGKDDPRFDAQKIRGPFDSVPDELLYRLVLDEIAHLPKDKPYFITAQTFWSHRPFMAPDGSQLNGEEPVIRLTDAHLGFLYRELQKIGFFDNGILFVTGDHRAMEPYRKAEFDRFGASAINRIPAIVVTHAVELPKVIADDFQQRDLKTSIEALVQDRYCADAYEGAFLGPSPAPPACIMQAKGDDRDLVFVQCGGKDAVVRIAGDKTAVVNGAVADERRALQAINYTRARAKKAGTGVLAASVRKEGNEALPSQ